MKKILFIFLFLSNLSFAYGQTTCFAEAFERFIQEVGASKASCVTPPDMSNENGWCALRWLGYPSPTPGRFYTCQVECFYYSGTGSFVANGEMWMPTCSASELETLSSNYNLNTSPMCRKGSVIQVSNQVVGEFIPLVGSSFSLSYFSNRVVGRKADYQLKVPVTTDNIISGITTYKVELLSDVGAVVQSSSFENIPNQNYSYEWDGKEEGSSTWGSTIKHIKITQSSDIMTFSQPVLDISLGNFKAIKLGLGGWVPTVWHFYDHISKTMFLGDGSVQKNIVPVVEGSYTRIANSSGKEVYYFDSTGKITLIKTPLTGSVLYSFNYDSNERLLSISEPFNRITTFTRYLNGKLKAIITPEKVKTVVKINSHGYLTKVTNPNNEIHAVTYNGAGGLLTSFIKPNGAISNMTYDEVGNLVSDIHSGGSSSTLAKAMNGINTVSTMGRLTKNSFFKDSNTEVQISPSSFMESFSNSNASEVYKTQAMRRSTVYINDPRFGSQVKSPVEMNIENFGTRNTTISRTANLLTSTDPFSINSLIDIFSVGNSEVISTYNGSTRIKEITTKLGRKIKIQIDEFERPVMIQKGDQLPQKLTYTDGKLSKITQGTRKIVLNYYPNKLLKSIRNTLGEITSYTYDKAQRLYSKTLPDSRLIDYDYDSEGNLVKIWPPERRGHELTYGANEKLFSYKPPAADWGATETITNYSYNLDKQLTKIERADGKNVNFNYNLTTGLLDSIVSDSGTVNYASYTFESPSVINYNGFQMRVNYLGNVVRSLALLDASFNHIYNYQRTPDSIAGEKIGTETINGGNSSSISQAINYSYNDDEMLSSAGEMELQYNTLNGYIEHTKLGSIRDYYYYNSFGEVRSYKAKFQSNEIYSYDLIRDSIGRIVQKKETLNGVTSTNDYVFDSSGRLIEVKLNGVTSSTYVYDENSNRIEGMIRGEVTAADYERQDRLIQYNDTGYNYNLNGDLDYKGLPSGEISESSEYFNYDVFGNLSEYTGRSNIRYEIDPFLRRLGKKVDGELKERYIYNPEGQLIGELDATNRLVKTFVYATKSHVPDYYIDSSNNKFRIITDNLGSIRLLIAVTSGRVLKIMEHDEFGRILQDTRPGFLPFGFAGGVYEKETGLVRFGARDYDPETGRWLSKDPIRFNGGDTNLYGYVMQDPINLVDPSGLTPGDTFNGYVFGAANYAVGAGYGVVGATYQTIGYVGGAAGGTAGFAASIPVNFYNQATSNPQRVNLGSDAYNGAVNWGNDNANSSYGQMSNYFNKGNNLFNNGYEKGCNLNGK